MSDKNSPYKYSAEERKKMQSEAKPYDEYHLSAEAYETLNKVDLNDLGTNMFLIPESCSFIVTDVKELFHLLNLEIACEGMDDEQQYTNEYGKKLYKLYDEIYFQREEKRKKQSF